MSMMKKLVILTTLVFAAACTKGPDVSSSAQNNLASGSTVATSGTAAAAPNGSPNATAPAASPKGSPAAAATPASFAPGTAPAPAPATAPAAAYREVTLP